MNKSTHVTEPNATDSGLPSIWLSSTEADRRAPLTAQEIVDGVIRIVESEGVEALTMRRLASELDTSTSSVYWRFADRDELLLAATDRVADHLFGAVLEIDSTDLEWHETLRSYGVAVRARFRENADLLPLIRGQTGVTPATLRFAEEVLRVLTEAGFSGPRLRDAFNAYTAYVVGFSMVEMSRRPLSERWVEAIPRYLASISGDDFPHIVDSLDLLGEQAFFFRSSGEVAFDEGFVLGLESLLIGFAAALDHVPE